MLLGMAISSLAVGRWGEAFGRRRTYVGLLVTMGVAGAVFALTGFVPLLVRRRADGYPLDRPERVGTDHDR